MFLIYIFLHQMRKQCLEFALPNPGEIFRHMAGAYNSNSHARRVLISYFCVRKQAEKPMQRRKALKEICHRKAQHYPSFLKREKPLQFLIPLTLLPKNHNLFCEGKEGLKKGGERKEKSVTTSLKCKTTYNTWGRGVCEERGGGG